MPRAAAPRPARESRGEPSAPAERTGAVDRLPTWLKAVGPLSLLAILVVAFLKAGAIGVFKQVFPPIEELTSERVRLPEPGSMHVTVVNGGPEPSTIAQVMVDDAIWAHSLDGDRTIGRLERRTITIPY